MLVKKLFLIKTRYCKPKENDNRVKPDALEKKKKLLEQLLKINEKHYGPNHPHTAITMGNLGVVLYELGHYEKARGYLQQNINVFIKHYGANHAETKRVKRNLAILENQTSQCIVM